MPGTDRASMVKRAASVIERGAKPVVPMPGTVKDDNFESGLKASLSVPKIPMPTGLNDPSEIIDTKLKLSAVNSNFRNGFESSELLKSERSSLARIGDGIYGGSTPNLGILIKI